MTHYHPADQSVQYVVAKHQRQLREKKARGVGQDNVPCLLGRYELRNVCSQVYTAAAADECRRAMLYIAEMNGTGGSSAQFATARDVAAEFHQGAQPVFLPSPSSCGQTNTSGLRRASSLVKETICTACRLAQILHSCRSIATAPAET